MPQFFKNSHFHLTPLDHLFWDKQEPCHKDTQVTCGKVDMKRKW